MRKFQLSLIILFFSSCVMAQVDAPVKKKKGQIYFTWGYHRDAYTTSTIRFYDHTTDNYDFKFIHAHAKDQPNFDHFLHTDISVPQFSATIGYIFANKNGWGIELSTDHLKYVVTDNQVMHLVGDIRGKHYDQDTLVTPDFVHYEHTNGNNYHMVNVIKKNDWWVSKSGKSAFSTVVKAGAGILLPKTASTVLGGFNDGPYKIAGFVVGISGNVRYQFLRYIFLEGTAKGCYADFTAAKLINDGRAKQHFFSIQGIASIGFNFPL